MIANFRYTKQCEQRYPDGKEHTSLDLSLKMPMSRFTQLGTISIRKSLLMRFLRN